MDDEQFGAPFAEQEPHEWQTTDEEFETGPDFAGIAERIGFMVRMGDDGWWGGAGSWDGEDETSGALSGRFADIPVQHGQGSTNTVQPLIFWKRSLGISITSTG